MAIQWIALCAVAAMICAMLRPQRPEMAMALSLAVGAAVFAAMAGQARAWLSQADGLAALFARADGDMLSTLLRAAGITVIAELGGQLCRDAGESALAGRIALISRVAILALCAPIAARLVDLLRQCS